jgi:hypothetical protein
MEGPVSGEDIFIEFTHEGVRERAAGAVSHGTFVGLSVEFSTPLEMGKEKDGFQQGDVVVDGECCAS